MHPEVRQTGPGKCPKCGMALTIADEKPIYPVSGTDDKGLGFLTWRSYIPLGVIIFLIGIVAAVVSWPDHSVVGESSLSEFVRFFMTGFFIVFAGFKLMDLKGFADGYATYDLLAQKVRAYAFAYPFIELAFGLLMLAGFHPAWLLWAEAGVMALSGIGVAIKLAKGEQFQCACLGTFLKVPLTKITVVEDFGMAVLALVLLWIS